MTTNEVILGENTKLDSITYRWNESVSVKDATVSEFVEELRQYSITHRQVTTVWMDLAMVVVCYEGVNYFGYLNKRSEWVIVINGYEADRWKSGNPSNEPYWKVDSADGRILLSPDYPGHLVEEVYGPGHSWKGPFTTLGLL